MNTLYVMRGCSGAGKSTKAREIAPETHIFSTNSLVDALPEGYDAFFASMREKGDFGPLDAMHRLNLQRAMDAMDACLDPVVIDNTNLSIRECRPYVEHAKSRGYAIRLVDVGTGGLTAEQLATRNKHNVPLDVILKMIEKHRLSHYTEEDIA